MHSAQEHPIAGVYIVRINLKSLRLFSVAPCLPEAQLALGKMFNLRNIIE